MSSMIVLCSRMEDQHSKSKQGRYSFHGGGSKCYNQVKMFLCKSVLAGGCFSFTSSRPFSFQDNLIAKVDNFLQDLSNRVNRYVLMLIQ